MSEVPEEREAFYLIPPERLLLRNDERQRTLFVGRIPDFRLVAIEVNPLVAALHQKVRLFQRPSAIIVDKGQITAFKFQGHCLGLTGIEADFLEVA